MPIDPRIALGYQPPQMESPVNMMLTAQKMQAGQQENALRQAQMENYQAEVARRNALLPHEIAKAEREATAANLKLEADAVKLANDRYGAYRRAVGALAIRPNVTKQDAVNAAAGLVTSGVLDQATVDAMVGQLPDDPVALQQAIRQNAVMDLTPEQVLTVFAPKATQVNAANRTEIIDTNPNSPTYGKLIKTVVHGLSPEQARTAAQEGKAVAHTITDEAGNVTLLNKFGQVVTPTADGEAATIKGKPSATFEKNRALREQLNQDLTTAIAELKDITKDGGLIDQSTGSGAGRAVDFAAGFIGEGTPGAIAAAQLKPIADLALKMVPRFQGPQSDKDAASYREASGQLADATLPSKVRKAAGKTVLRLMENRKNQFVTQGMAAEGVGTGAAADHSKKTDAEILAELGVKP